MKYINLCLVLILFSVNSFAENRNFTLVDNSTGISYQCGQGGGGGTMDPNCIPTVADTCSKETAHGSSYCFDLAKEACKNTQLGYGSCVRSTTEYCKNNTAHGSSYCFDEAIKTCKGTPQDLIQFIDKIKEESLLNEKNLKEDLFKKKAD